MMALYSTALCVGAAISAGVAVPLENLLGGWRLALAAWLLPVLVTMVVWKRHIPGKQATTTYKPGPLPKLYRNKLAWQVTLLMGLQSSIAYRSEEHTSELQSLMRVSYAVVCVKLKKHITQTHAEHAQ